MEKTFEQLMDEILLDEVNDETKDFHDSVKRMAKNETLNAKDFVQLIFSIAYVLDIPQSEFEQTVKRLVVIQGIEKTVMNIVKPKQNNNKMN